MIQYIQFAKMSGAGNDFVVIDNRQDQFVHPDRVAQRLCDRRLGIGADGLLLIEKNSRADFTMKYYNADGSYGGMCGNGGRCIAMYAFHEHIVTGRVMKFEALDHLYRAEIGEGSVHLAVKDPVDLRLDKTLAVDGLSIRYHFVNTGTAHCVIFVDENPDMFATPLEDADITPLGRKLRYHEAFAPEGTNVNFITVESPELIVLRTYERGVEAETLACGTGSVASSIIAHKFQRVQPPVAVRVRSGELLRVNFTDDARGKARHVTLEGGADIIYKGTVVYDTIRDMIVTTG
jgi:diaminopimelate epimerase